MVKIFGMASISDTLFVIEHMQVMEFEFISHGPYLGFEKQVITLIQRIQSGFVLYVTFLRNRQH